VEFKKLIAPCIIVAMIFAAAGFIVGYKINKSKTADTTDESTTSSADSTLYGTEDDPYLQYDYSTYLDLGDYTGLTAVRSIQNVTDDEVLETIDQELTDSEDVTRGIEEGDYVVMDFTGTIDGEEFDGGTAEDYEIQIGENEVIEDLENGLLGAKAGDSLTIPVTFPDDYDDDTLAGKDAEFAVTISEVYVMTTKELTEETAQDMGYDSVEAYKEAVRENLEEEYESDADDTLDTDLFTQVMDNSELKDYTEEMYDQIKAEIDEEISATASQWGMDEDSVKLYFYGIEEDDDYTAIVEERMLEELVSEAIAAKENLLIDEDTYQEEAYNLAVSMEYDSVEDLEADYDRDEIRAYLIKLKIYDFLKENATITDEYVDADDSDYDYDVDEDADEDVDEDVDVEE
jgi:trigger factor